VDAESNENCSYVGLDVSKIISQSGESSLKLLIIERGTILHEFGHALGLHHAHQNPAAELIPWDKDTVYHDFKQGINNWEKDKVDSSIFKLSESMYSYFDPYSIMCYQIKGHHLLESKYSVPNKNTELSLLDKEMINRMYPFLGNWSGLWKALPFS
jgi:hypothetical protein